MKLWLIAGWTAAAAAALAIARLPRVLDLYFSDRYVPVPRSLLLLALFLLVVLPLLVAGKWRSAKTR